jgi:hypothetical protein
MASRHPAAGDDRLATLTRAGFAPLIPLTAIFGPALVIAAGDTADFWAWEIAPDSSAAFLGAGYVFGAITITTMLVVGRWRSAIVPVVSTLPFSVALLGATLLHLDRFFTGSIRFWVWFVIYAALPLLMPGMWLVNRSHDPGRRAGEAMFPRPLALAIAAAGAAVTALGALMFVDPGFADSIWPWELTPLMARIVAAWLLFWGPAAFCLGFERRYVAYRPFLPTAAVWPAVLLAASWAYAEDFSSDGALWRWRGVLIGLLLAELALFAYGEQRLHHREARSVARPRRREARRRRLRPCATRSSSKRTRSPTTYLSMKELETTPKSCRSISPAAGADRRRRCPRPRRRPRP